MANARVRRSLEAQRCDDCSKECSAASRPTRTRARRRNAAKVVQAHRRANEDCSDSRWARGGLALGLQTLRDGQAAVAGNPACSKLSRRGMAGTAWQLRTKAASGSRRMTRLARPIRLPSAGNKSNARLLSRAPTLERRGCRGWRQAASTRLQEIDYGRKPASTSPLPL
jgi:hypothetical protein